MAPTAAQQEQQAAPALADAQDRGRRRSQEVVDAGQVAVDGLRLEPQLRGGAREPALDLGVVPLGELCRPEGAQIAQARLQAGRPCQRGEGLAGALQRPAERV
ncbi:hypothetical protein OV079_36245 [Nannocystis pusilla]|uniref:Uncharacterized protein n=1 Tax=Nannocystis pusilla TaxID=889268 RepID=A0A9X3EWR1_9BACT|nr:hypothetical protein [Nannocystis pusilla]MCY1010925.1 hypothetical protein [Nannocystis pusilla]